MNDTLFPRIDRHIKMEQPILNEMQYKIQKMPHNNYEQEYYKIRINEELTGW